MSSWSANLELPFLAAAQAQKHVTHNEALERLDAIVQLTVKGFDATMPPTSTTDGEVWALGPGAVNDWVGHDGELAVWSNGGWLFVTPRPGWRAANGTELRIWDGAAWSSPDLPALQNLPGVGINATYDGTNRLAVSAAATLLSHEGAGHQLKINKASPVDSASLLYQTGWSGRAEMGLAGTDDFSLKVSANGTSWVTALGVNGATGAAAMLSGLTIAGKTAYHRGNILGTVSQVSGGPTGALFERGSNANGSYLRLAGGTQICWASVAPSGPDSVWTFPAAFVSSANLVLTGAGRTGTNNSFVSFRPPTNITVAYNHWKDDGTRIDGLGCSIVAIGSWF